MKFGGFFEVNEMRSVKCTREHLGLFCLWWKVYPQFLSEVKHSHGEHVICINTFDGNGPSLIIWNCRLGCKCDTKKVLSRPGSEFRKRSKNVCKLLCWFLGRSNFQIGKWKTMRAKMMMMPTVRQWISIVSTSQSSSSLSPSLPISQPFSVRLQFPTKLIDEMNHLQKAKYNAMLVRGSGTEREEIAFYS